MDISSAGVLKSKNPGASSAGATRSNSRQPANPQNRKIIIANNKDSNNSDESDGDDEEKKKKGAPQIQSMIGEFTIEELKK